MTAPVGAPIATDPAVLTRAECEALTGRVLELVGDVEAEVDLSSFIQARAEFARGEIHMASLTRELSASQTALVDERRAYARTNQMDEAGMRALVARTEQAARESPSKSAIYVRPPQTYLDGPQIAFDSTIAGMMAQAQAALVDRAIAAADAAGLVAAGEVLLQAGARAVRNSAKLAVYEISTYGEFSMTARSGKQGSGWGWSGYEDWSRVDVEAVIRRAVDLGARSSNPVALEPGRYTVILEPSAVAQLVAQINGGPTWWMSKDKADVGRSVFSKQPLGTNKIGLQMMDRRLRMVSSPWDPDRPASTIDPWWKPIPRPIVWFEEGVLQTLTNAPDPVTGKQVINPGGARLEATGPAQALDGMIASTKRGIWVNRFSHIAPMDEKTLMLTGTTRDGTFLIENGKITKAIKNFRFTESPFFVFNRLEAWGEPVRASREIVAPRLKLRDFNFTSLTDAI